jgi:hypothetical protein
MIDFSKAFDRIDHNIVLHKVRTLDVPPILISWCADFLQHLRVNYKLGSIKSHWKIIHAGVPQVKNLAILLFMVMINDLSSNLSLYKYVDDCTIYKAITSPYTGSLQKELDDICNWSEANKTKELRISFLKQAPGIDFFTTSGTQVECVTHF